MEGYEVVYSTLAGDQYDKVIVPRNEGATTKTTLTGKWDVILFRISFYCAAIFFQCAFFVLMPSQCFMTVHVCWRSWDTSLFYMAGLSPVLTLGWWATDCICRIACCPAGVLKGCHKEGVSWDFFFPPERPCRWKGQGLHKNRSKRSSCFLCSAPAIDALFSALVPSLSLSFSVGSKMLARLLVFHSWPLQLYSCILRNSIWNGSIMQLAKDK